MDHDNYLFYAVFQIDCGLSLINHLYITHFYLLEISGISAETQAETSNNVDNSLFTSSGVYLMYFSMFFVNCIAIYL